MHQKCFLLKSEVLKVTVDIFGDFFSDIPEV